MSERLLFSQRETAERLGVSTKTLLAEVRAGHLRYVLIGKSRRFAEVDIAEFIERKRVTWPSEGAKGRRTGTSISRSKVIGFEEAVKRRTTRRPESSRPS